MITKSRLKEWLQDEVTIAWRNGIKTKIRELEETLGLGHTLTGHGDSTLINTGMLVGQIQGLKDALEINEEEVIEENA